MLKKVILGSTSPYRQSLLKKMGIPFSTLAPSCDEDQIKNELRQKHVPKKDWARILSESKSRSITTSELLITSDQTLVLGDEIFGKPKTAVRAVEQLELLQGKTHQLITAATVRVGNEMTSHVQVDQMRMRSITRAELERYVALDQPLDCAGSYKLEGAGLGLFEKIECPDFSGIQGLPMIWLCLKLKEMGYELFEAT